VRDVPSIGAPDAGFLGPGGGERIGVAVVHRLPEIGASRRDEAEGRRRASHRTLVEPHGGGVAAAFGRRWGDRSPTGAYAVATLAGWAVLALVVALLGLLVTDVLLRSGAIADADAWLPEWLAEQRRPWLTDASSVASRIADVPVIPGLVIATLVVAAFARRFRIGIFLATAIVLEVTLYRLTAWAAPRERPDVPRLDDLPALESFPSGHVAAATVVYVGLALIVSSWARRPAVTVTAWSLAVAIVLAVALSRVYRGMHHPLDSLGGVLLGLGCRTAT
jgi:membrane-associated phospholipid phosphatase